MCIKQSLLTSRQIGSTRCEDLFKTIKLTTWISTDVSTCRPLHHAPQQLQILWRWCLLATDEMFKWTHFSIWELAAGITLQIELTQLGCNTTNNWLRTVLRSHTLRQQQANNWLYKIIYYGLPHTNKHQKCFVYCFFIDALVKPATGYVTILCLSKARINWYGCCRKGIWHKNGGMMEVGAVGTTAYQ